MQVFVVGSFVVACSVKVTRLPRAGESLSASAFVAEAGGKGFNLALALHRLGAIVDGAFAIGSDPFAAIATSAFEKAGLLTSMLIVHEAPTGAGVGFVDDLGENCLAVSLGANRHLGVDDVAGAARLSPGSLCLATFESPDIAIREAFRLARARGATTLLNPSPSRPLDPDILGSCDIIVVNELEAADLGLRPDGNAGGDVAIGIAGHEPTLVVTRGAEGAIAYRPGMPSCRQQAFRVPVIDTIGAGDAFTAGLAAGLLQGLPIEAALRTACACGALTAAHHGTFDAFPTRRVLEQFLAHHVLDA